ncbi:MAG: hypothetical protein JWO42_3203 [Chloroflexi bacterium]|nr:hypothetical protein [Chloroflexota bacterium]
METSKDRKAMAIKTAQELFLTEVSDVYDAENRLMRGMESMAEKASDATLKAMLREHVSQTQGQIRNLDNVFGILGAKPESRHSDAADGLVSEAKKSMNEASADSIRDCIIDNAAAKNEHFEIASYRGLISSAQKMMGQQQLLSLLQENLSQEEQAAQRLEQTAPQLLEKVLQQYPM